VSAALFSKDILDFLALLRRHKVRYLVVGGEAVIQYGYARFTADMDLFYDNAEPNVERLYQALLEFWGGSVPGIESSRNLRATGKIFQFGSPPNRLDLMNRIDGTSFEAGWKGRRTVRLTHRGRSLAVHFIGLEELIRNKRAAGRNKDLDDLRYLLAARKLRRQPPAR